MVGPIHGRLLGLLLVMVGHAGKGRGANGQEDILLVLGLLLGLRLDLVLGGAVGRAVRGGAVGGLLMLIHWRP